MMLVLVLAILTVAVLAVVILPIIKGIRAVPERAQFDRAVYRDQLEELNRDVARGLIGEREAAMARIEIERRLLATDAAPPSEPARRGRSPVLAGALTVLIALGAAGIYLHLGAPQIPDMPFALRGQESDVAAAGGHTDMAKAAAALAEKLKQDPGNVEGWLLLARTEASLNHWQTAADAFHHVLTLRPDQADAEAGYGEMLVMAAEGVVTPAAHDAFADAVKHDPRNDIAQFYLALADAQIGNVNAAIQAWLKVAAEEPDGSDIREEVARRITEAARVAGISPPALPPPAPAADMEAGAAGAAAPGDAAAVAAVSQMPPEEQTDVIKGMVAQLAQRLQSNPNDIDGWLRLGRSYAVLGQNDKAADAYDHAAKLKPEDVTIPLQEVDALLSGQSEDAELPAPVITVLHRIEAIDPNQPEALWYLGFAAAQGHRVDEAKRYWQRLLPLLPADSAERKKVTVALDSLAVK